MLSQEVAMVRAREVLRKLLAPLQPSEEAVRMYAWHLMQEEFTQERRLHNAAR